MKILALDIATKTGWALGGRSDTPLVGNFDLPGLSGDLRAKSCASLYSAVHALVRGNGVEVVAIEQALSRVKRTNKRGITTPSSAHGDSSLAMLQGAAQAAVVNGGAKLLTVLPHVWRQAVLGARFPVNPNAAAIDYCWTTWKMNMASHDAADAACILVWAHSQELLL